MNPWVLFAIGLVLGLAAGIAWLQAQQARKVQEATTAAAEKTATLQAELAAAKASLEHIQREFDAAKIQHGTALNDQRLVHEQAIATLTDAQERALTAQREQLNSELAKREAKIAEQEPELIRLREDYTRVAEREKALEAKAEEMKQMLDDADKKLREAFSSLSVATLEKLVPQFLAQAEEKLKSQQELGSKDLQEREEAIRKLIEPVQQTLATLNDKTQQLEVARAEQHGTLKQQLEQLTLTHTQLSSETEKLNKALRSAKARGRWGEIALERLVEMAGLTPHVDFTTQTSLQTDEGDRLRPDMTVRLPGNRVIVIDSKVPFDGYYDASEASDEEHRKAALERHAQAVAGHIRTLTRKDYQKHLPEAAEFIVMFVPNDTFLAAAIETRPDLLEAAMRDRVILVTPAALLALLLAIAQGWRQEAAAQSAKEIQALGEELCERLGVFIGYLHDVNRHLERMQESWRKAMGSFHSRVLVTARRFEGLGVKTTKPLELSIEGAIIPALEAPVANGTPQESHDA